MNDSPLTGSDSLSNTAQQVLEKYHFSFNQAATDKLAALSDQVFRRISGSDTLLFNLSSPDSKIRQFIHTDRDYTVLESHEIITETPWQVGSVERIGDEYIICYIDSVTTRPVYRADIYAKNFKRQGTLADKHPFFEGKQIAYVVADSSGGLFLLEAYSGTLHHMDSDGNISSYTDGPFTLPTYASFFNDTLYIVDLHKALYLQLPSNIVTFRNGTFQETGLLGGCIEPSRELGCYFVSSNFTKNVVQKYDMNNTLIFEKNFAFDPHPITPRGISVNENQLIILDKRPYVYDIS